MISGQEVRDARSLTVVFSGRLIAIKRANLEPVSPAPGLQEVKSASH
jgi:hypothetical protein